MRWISMAIALREYVFPSGCAACGCGLLDLEEALLGVCRECARILRCDDSPRCVSCGRPLVSESGDCLSCRGRSAAYCDGAYSLFPYAGLPRRFFLSFKFGSSRGAAGFAAGAIAGVVESRRSEIGADARIVPVPPRPGKLKSRGWDQVEAIVSLMRSSYGLPVSRCLIRLPGKTQKKLNRAERSENMRAAFRCVSAPPERAVLVDDVYTTGATLNACAEVLKKAGCRCVFAVSLCYD